MEELDLALVKKRSVVGVLALTSRTFLLQIINFGSMFLLTVFLSPDIFGIYFVVTAVVNFLNYFSDIGLAAALVQKKDAITEEDLKTTFTIQQILVIGLVCLSLFFSFRIGKFYNLSPNGIQLLRALIIAFFLSSLKTVPSILLERKLDFGKLVFPQIGETVVFNLVAVFFAWKGMGVNSFTWAVLARGVVGLILIYIVSPWKIGFSINREAAKKLLSFGIPFQTNSLLALLKDDLLTVFLGKRLPFVEVGYIGWAQKWANMPLRFVMDNVIRVSFPAYSRVQHDLNALRSGVERALFGVCLISFPILIGLAAMAFPLVNILPKYLKWQPALICLYLYCFQAVLSCVSTTLTNTLNAIGKIHITLKMMILWTSLTWLFTPIFISFIGFNGVALSALLVSLSIVIPIMVVKRMVNFSVWENVGKPLLSALLMGAVVLLLSKMLPLGVGNLLLSILIGGIAYAFFIFLMSKHKIIESYVLIRESLKK